MQKYKWLSGEALQMAVKRREVKNKRDDFTYEHRQMVNIKVRLITFFVAKDGEALYSQQKQDQELTAAQIMNFLLPNSDSN